jgi:hypothetical protein
VAPRALRLIARHAARGQGFRHSIKDFRGRVMPGPGFRSRGNRRWRGTFHHGVKQETACQVRVPAALDSLAPDSRLGGAW